MNIFTSAIRALSDHHIAAILAPPLTALASYSVLGPYPCAGTPFEYLGPTGHQELGVLIVHVAGFLFQTAIAFVAILILEAPLSQWPAAIALTGLMFVSVGIFLLASGVVAGAATHPIVLCGLAALAIGFSMLRPIQTKPK